MIGMRILFLQNQKCFFGVFRYLLYLKQQRGAPLFTIAHRVSLLHTSLPSVSKGFSRFRANASRRVNCVCE